MKTSAHKRQTLDGIGNTRDVLAYARDVSDARHGRHGRERQRCALTAAYRDLLDQQHPACPEIFAAAQRGDVESVLRLIEAAERGDQARDISPDAAPECEKAE